MDGLRISLADTVKVARTRFPKAYKELFQHAQDLVFVDINGVPAVLIGRLVIKLNNNSQNVIRDVLALLSPKGDRVGFGFANNGGFVEIRTWPKVNIQFCAPFVLLDKEEDSFKAKLETFVQYCFLVGQKRQYIVAGLEYGLDMKEIAEDVGWNWKMWKESGGRTALQFMEETTNADKVLAKEREQEAIVMQVRREKEAFDRAREDAVKETREKGEARQVWKKPSIFEAFHAEVSTLPAPRKSTSPIRTSFGNRDISMTDDEMLPEGFTEIHKLQRHIRGLSLSREQKDSEDRERNAAENE